MWSCVPILMMKIHTKKEKETCKYTSLTSIATSEWVMVCFYFIYCIYNGKRSLFPFPFPVNSIGVYISCTAFLLSSQLACVSEVCMCLHVNRAFSGLVISGPMLGHRGLTGLGLYPLFTAMPIVGPSTDESTE